MPTRFAERFDQLIQLQQRVAYLERALRMIVNPVGLVPMEFASTDKFFKEQARICMVRINIAHRAMSGCPLAVPAAGLLAVLTPQQKEKALAYEGDDAAGEIVKSETV